MTVAIGGIGGSGTRLGSLLLQLVGYHIGDDLNPELDNLSFTFLFNDFGALNASPEEFAARVDLFWSAMAGQLTATEEQNRLLTALVESNRHGYDRAWSQERAASLLRGTGKRHEPWGWKEPNTHVVIDRLWAVRPALRYMHFVRPPLDMAFAKNQNQLRFWGPTFLGRVPVIGPRDALSYWCVVDRRIRRLANEHPDRVLFVDFDRLCDDPGPEIKRIAAFIGVDAGDSAVQTFRSAVDPSRPKRIRLGTQELSQFDPGDLEYVRSTGLEF